MLTYRKLLTSGSNVRTSTSGLEVETLLVIADDNNYQYSSATRLVLQDLLVPADVLIADTTGHCWAVSVVCCVDTWLIA